MIKLDVEFPEDCEFPSLFWTVYVHCLLKAGLADHFSVVNGDIFVLNALFNNGVISHEYTEYIYANSCRNVVSGMAEWNGGFAYINDDGKSQVDVFSKEVSRTFNSGDLMDFDYSDETVVFSKIKTSQKNKTYEMGDDSGYTLVINNQYISYGLDDDDFEMYLGFICDYYKGFSLTPMSLHPRRAGFRSENRRQNFGGGRGGKRDGHGKYLKNNRQRELLHVRHLRRLRECFGVVNYNKSSFSQTQQAKSEAAQESGNFGSAVTSYEYLTDSSVKLNGVTYIVEKNADGLISKISDSSGNSLKPTINGEITDISTHNSVFWAVAMARGLSANRSPIGTYIYDCNNYDLGKKLWINQAGGPALDLSKATISEDGIYGVRWALDIIPSPLSKFTVYIIARAIDYSTLSRAWLTVMDNGGVKPEFNLCSYNRCWSVGTGDNNYYTGSKTADSFALLVMRRNENTGEFYINGSKMHTYNGYYPYVGDVDKSFHLGGDNFMYKYIGFYNEYHSDSEMQNKTMEPSGEIQCIRRTS